MVFTIVDENGKEYYHSDDHTIIQTEGVFNKDFGELNLPIGKYFVVLKTLYNIDVSDEFKQEFEVVSASLSANTCIKNNWPSIIFLSIIFIIIIFGFRKKSLIIAATLITACSIIFGIPSNFSSFASCTQNYWPWIVSTIFIFSLITFVIKTISKKNQFK